VKNVNFCGFLVTLWHCLLYLCAGKTTLLKILAGKHMVGGRDVVRVLNRSAFHDTQLVCGGDLAYLGGSWSKTVGSAVSS
jgi:CCR4-NOT complex subunit CAF16